MTQENKIEIPFGASDSELYYEEIIIPDGFEAIIQDGKIILRRKETKDEKIRKNCIHFLELQKKHHASTIEIDECIAWLKKQGGNNNQNWKPSKEQISALEHFLRSIGESGYASPYDSNTKLLYSLINDLYELEKQGEQKPADKVELKFHKGDWLCENEPNNYARFIQILEIVNVQGKGRYRISRDIHNDEDTIEFDFVEKYYHKFDIKDARDGDVLAGSKRDIILMFRGIGNTEWDNVIDYHCYYDCYHKDFIVQKDIEYWGNTKNNQLVPATKEQRGLLFQKIREAGWEWDVEAKKLNKKLEAFPILSNSSKTGKDWTEEDTKAIDNCCLLIGAADECYEKAFKDACIHYLQNLKQRMEQ